MSLAGLLVVFNSLHCSAFNCLHFFNALRVLIYRLWYQSGDSGVIVEVVPHSKQVWALAEKGSCSWNVLCVCRNAGASGQCGGGRVRGASAEGHGVSLASVSKAGVCCRETSVAELCSCASLDANRLFFLQLMDWSEVVITGDDLQWKVKLVKCCLIGRRRNACFWHGK